MPAIEARIDVQIEYVSGQRIENPAHVLAWICADGQYYEGRAGGFVFEVCPTHADPDECPEGDTVSRYQAIIVSAEL